MGRATGDGGLGRGPVGPPPLGQGLPVRGRVFHREGEMRLLVDMPWMGGWTLCTIPAGLAAPPPFPRAELEDKDVPGDEFPGVPRPRESRRIFHLAFDGGGLACYRLGSQGEARAASVIRGIRAEMEHAGWTPDQTERIAGLLTMERPENICWIWSPPAAQGVEYIAMCVRRKGGKND